MFATIVLGIIIILSIFLLIVCILSEDEHFGIPLGLTLFAIVMLIISLICGKSIYKQDNTDILFEKQAIEYCLENDNNIFIIEKAQKYNKEIDSGNNLWCRFSIEDRSEFKIDIDSYIKKE